jgi:ribosomal protein L11 methyltransferase
MEDHLRPGERVLDLGCGSGILCEAARILNAGMVAGCDIDLQAVAIARVTSGGRARLFNGSARAVCSDSIDFVVANINAETICNVSGDMKRMLRSGGRAVLSGFPHKHVSRVRASMQSHGLVELELREKSDWACMVVSRP